MLIEIVCLVMAVLWMTGLMGETGVLIYMLDLPTLLILLVLALPALFANGLAGDFVRLFYKNKNKKESLGDLKKSLLAVELLQKQFIYAALMTVALDIVVVLHQSVEPEVLRANFSVVAITAFYLGILELILMPIKVAVEKRITEHMESDS